MKLTTTMATFALALVAALALTPAPTQAGCTQDGTTVTCSGDLLNTTSDDFNYTTVDGVDTLIVEDIDDSYSIDDTTIMSLTDVGDAGADDGDNGSDGDDLTITYDPGSELGFEGERNPYGIEISSQGGAGHSGKEGNDEAGEDAGDGGDGGDATLSMMSGYFSESGTDTSNGTGISATSTGGAGGNGGESKTGDNDIDLPAYAGNGGAAVTAARRP